MNEVQQQAEVARERFVVFDCEGDKCVGIVSLATTTATAQDGGAGVLIVVGGPQYRVGSHRQFTLLARTLAGAGIPVFRFDYRGMGDSEGALQTFESIGNDLSKAIDAFQRETGVARIILWGLCDGASAALMYAADDQRVAGVIAVNPWARFAQGEASVRLRHYYLRRFFSRDLWRKVVRGRLDVRRSSGELAGALRDAVVLPRTCPATYLQRMHEGWMRFDRPILFILSGQDYTAREFESWAGSDAQRSALFQLANCEICPFPDADHTFSSRAWRDALAAMTIKWIDRVVR